MAEVAVAAPDAEPNLANALRGRGRLQVSSYADKHPSAAIASVPDFEVKELEYTSFAGEPVYVASNGRGETRIIPLRGEPKATVRTGRRHAGRARGRRARIWPSCG